MRACNGDHRETSTWSCCFEFCIWRFWDQVAQAAWLTQVGCVSMSQLRRFRAMGKVRNQ